MKYPHGTWMQCLIVGLCIVACGKITPSTSQANAETTISASTLHSDPATREIICHHAPGKVPGMNCISAKLATRNNQPCRHEGQDVDGKDFGSTCCPGLTAIATSHPSNTGCTRSAPPSIQICSRCGDQICGVGENHCNCPQDCGIR